MSAQDSVKISGFEQPLMGVLKKCFGKNLLSVMLYGSYISGNFVKGVSDINILVILAEVDPEQLELFATTGHRVMRRHHITPLILTRQEFNNSSDVFPMEYYDIKDNNRVVHGVDETKSLSLTIKNLRHQIEDRLRGEIASLRQLVIVSRGRQRVLRRYLKLWAGSLNTVFRGLLRLKGFDPVPSDTTEILTMVKQMSQVDTSSFTRLSELRGGRKIDAVSLSHDILERLSEIIRVVDTMKV